MNLRDVFPATQLRHRTVKGRDETWVPAEWILHRLIETGTKYYITADIHAVEDCKVWENKKWVEGVRATVHVVLCIDDLRYDGLGASTDSGTDPCDALKSAHSYAVRHAAKNAGIGLHLWTNPVSAPKSASKEPDPEPTPVVAEDPEVQQVATQEATKAAGLVCEGCGSTAVKRTVKKAGKNQGRDFWTCPKRECNDLFEWADEVEDAVPF